jgi:hypothetical protein
MKPILHNVHPVLAANDIPMSVEFYRRLGFAVLHLDNPIEPKYAVVQRDGVQLHIQWADSNQWAYPTDRPAYRFLVSDVDAVYREFVERDCITPQTGQGSPWAAPGDTSWGTREFHLRDPGQNGLQFYRPLLAGPGG